MLLGVILLLRVKVSTSGVADTLIPLKAPKQNPKTYISGSTVESNPLPFINTFSGSAGKLNPLHRKDVARSSSQNHSAFHPKPKAAWSTNQQDSNEY